MESSNLLEELITQEVLAKLYKQMQRIFMTMLQVRLQTLPLKSPSNFQIPQNSTRGCLVLISNCVDTNAAINYPVVALEFHPFLNPRYGDPSDNHVGININSIRSVATLTLNTSMKNGSTDSHIGVTYQKYYPDGQYQWIVNFNAKLGDFGLARLIDNELGMKKTALAGTIGYLAPEYINNSKARKESDVFSFCVVALEIACRRRSIESKNDKEQISLVSWVWKLCENDELLDAADMRLLMDFNREQMMMFVGF
ncbi:Protein kinase domain [Dillenia turbinata]|uniref:Protein kinase domain n=1 Tax=Dillenia turbinata TaxID=194707 RepID=A0AAN8WC08_9MAGN